MPHQKLEYAALDSSIGATMVLFSLISFHNVSALSCTSLMSDVDKGEEHSPTTGADEEEWRSQFVPGRGSDNDDARESERTQVCKTQMWDGKREGTYNGEGGVEETRDGLGINGTFLLRRSTAPRNSGRECAELRQTSATTTRGARSGDSGLQRSSGKYPRLEPGRRTNSRAGSRQVTRGMAGERHSLETRRTEEDAEDAEDVEAEGLAVVLCRQRRHGGGAD
ncbi:hypothetical protein EYF80_026691 [Liparis tanakae]|uniref:Uncharacterized protein n=1 Tax=Liparis tanakae TaxID=230148 RepID=A0A4Z2HCS8_9TELE|nr:hypothetical protein EYF80_026691 [Liparis tanakae]